MNNRYDLATYGFRASAGAEGVWEVCADESAYLLDGDAVLIESAAGNVGLIRIGLECTTAAHCADGNQCTDDVCDGTGACVGTGSPCTKHYPQCCESLELCLEPETGYPQ